MAIRDIAVGVLSDEYFLDPTLPDDRILERAKAFIEDRL